MFKDECGTNNVLKVNLLPTLWTLDWLSRKLIPFSLSIWFSYQFSSRCQNSQEMAAAHIKMPKVTALVQTGEQADSSSVDFQRVESSLNPEPSVSPNWQMYIFSSVPFLYWVPGGRAEEGVLVLSKSIKEFVSFFLFLVLNYLLKDTRSH